MIETLQKSNSINLFKRQVNTLLSLKSTPQTLPFLKHFTLLRFALLCKMIVVLKLIYLSSFITNNTGFIYSFNFTY